MLLTHFSVTHNTEKAEVNVFLALDALNDLKDVWSNHWFYNSSSFIHLKCPLSTFKSLLNAAFYLNVSSEANLTSLCTVLCTFKHVDASYVSMENTFGGKYLLKSQSKRQQHRKNTQQTFGEVPACLAEGV